MERVAAGRFTVREHDDDFLAVCSVIQNVCSFLHAEVSSGCAVRIQPVDCRFQRINIRLYRQQATADICRITCKTDNGNGAVRRVLRNLTNEPVDRRFQRVDLINLSYLGIKLVFSRIVFLAFIMTDKIKTIVCERVASIAPLDFIIAVP